MKDLRIPPLMATAAVALSLVLGGCGGSSNTMEEDPPAPPVVPVDPVPQPVSVMMELDLSAAAQARLERVGGLMEAGDSDTLTIPAGGMMTVAAADSMSMGVVFTCQSMYPCTVTVTNSLGTIMATWESMMLPDGDAPMVTASAPVPPDTFARLNPADAESVAIIVDNPIRVDASATAGPYSNANTTIGGLGLEDIGPPTTDDNPTGDAMVTLTSDLDPNFVPAHVPAMNQNATGDFTDAAVGGSTVEAGVMNDELTGNADLVAAADWSHRVLFRDWGDTDTGGTRDGGFETGALVYSNIEESTMAPFNDALSGMFTNPWVEAWLDLDIDVDLDGTHDLVTIETAMRQVGECRWGPSASRSKVARRPPPRSISLPWKPVPGIRLTSTGERISVRWVRSRA